MKLFKMIFSLLVIVSLALPAFGLSLDEARKKGLVKELETGYLEAVKAEAKTLVKQVNAKRKKKYESISAKNGIPVSEIGKRTAKQIQTKLFRKKMGTGK